jgi:hypothetical protein
LSLPIDTYGLTHASTRLRYATRVMLIVMQYRINL